MRPCLDATSYPFVPKPNFPNNPIELGRNRTVIHNTRSQMSKNAVFVEGKFEKNGQEQEEKGNHVPRLPRNGRYQLRTFAQAWRGETAAQEIQSTAPTRYAPH